MTKSETVPLQVLLDKLGRRPAIVLGPVATVVPGDWENDISQELQKLQGDVFDQIIVNGSLGTNLDLLNSQDSAIFEQIKRSLKKKLELLTPSLDLKHIVRGGWSACVSLTLDLLFESALSDYLDSIPSSRTVTIVDSPSIQVPPRTTPVYKLLGNLNKTDAMSTLALADSELMVRKQSWSKLLSTFPDFVKDAPLLFLGTDNVIPLVQELLSTLHAMPRPNISGVVFLNDDATLSDPTVKALGAEIGLTVVDANIRELAASIAELKPRQTSLTLSTTSLKESQQLQSEIETFKDFVVIVPNKSPNNFDVAKHLAPLTDSLFRPTSIDWLPYLCELDLPRTLGPDLKAEALSALDKASQDYRPYIVLHGEAGVGKTTLLKRLACELARDGVLTLWCKKSVSGSWQKQYRQLAKYLINILNKKKQSLKKVAIICDDPWGLRLDAGELISCFEQFPVKIVFIFSFRNSDYFITDGPSLSLPLKPHVEVSVPFELDESELNQLGAMLVKIGASNNIEEANDAVLNVPSTNANDILCSLWYLVPETRSQLSDSLRDEYCRLGAIDDSISNIANDLANSSQVARLAYECVTVTSALVIDLPLEVLVRTLCINYDEWFDMCADGRPLWGLLYETFDSERETYVFRTRNEIVTRVLLNLVNGGVGHMGEARILGELLKSCDAGTPMYRNFILDVLVLGRSKLSNRLTFEQGMNLFEIARKTLPFQDRVIEHHMGIWMQDVGRNYVSAYTQFSNSLDCPVYPGAERDAPTQHIHTSMAASVVQMVREGSQDPGTGLELVREHVRQAASPSFFNLHTSHVSANLYFQLALKTEDNQTENVSLISFAEALKEIERSMQIIGAYGRKATKLEKSLEMLNSLNRQILDSIPDIDELGNTANNIFNTSGSQIGFEVLARKLLSEAIKTNKGRSYNQVNQYLDNCFDKIDAIGAKRNPDLIMVRIDLIIRWRIQRTGGSINWLKFRSDLEEILEVNQYRESVEKIFYYAVSLYHCGDSTKGAAQFANLRRLHAYALMPKEIRCYYLGKEGNPKRFQCTIARQGQRWYAEISELSIDVPIFKTPDEGGPGTTSHAYLGFALNGPVAVFHRPLDKDTLLAY